MYPLYWEKLVRRVIFMRYSQEFKIKCIEAYRQGKWPKTPKGIKQHNFRCMVRRWSRMGEANNSDVLNQKGFNKNWTQKKNLNWFLKYLQETRFKQLLSKQASMTVCYINEFANIRPNPVII